MKYIYISPDDVYYHIHENLGNKYLLSVTVCIRLYPFKYDHIYHNSDVLPSPDADQEVFDCVAEIFSRHYIFEAVI